MTEPYIPSGSVVPSNSREDLERKERLQRRHYYLLQELQSMARDLPTKYQQRLPCDMLSSLASSLLDNTLFEIVHGLNEIQHMTEKTALQRRMLVINKHEVERQNVLKKHKEDQALYIGNPQALQTLQRAQQIELQAIKREEADELRRTDRKIILDLDQQVTDQQMTLERAGVSVFYVTNNPTEIRLQMYLLEFIDRLRTSDLPSPDLIPVNS